MKRLSFILLLAAAALVIHGTGPAWAGPSTEKGPRCSDGIDNDGDGLVDGEDPDCGGSGGGGGGEAFLARGAVGHPLGCLACGDPTCAEGDFHDIGTVEGGCELLTCGSDNGKDLVCGRQGEPKPKLDITGLYGLWGAGDSQGDPTECFGDGIVGATVHASDQGGGGQVDLLLFFPAGVDGTLPGRCSGAADLVSYVVDLDGCTTPGPYPPAAGEAITVDCAPGAAIDVRTEGGGGIARKCGCTTTGVLAAGVEVQFLGE